MIVGVTDIDAFLHTPEPSLHRHDPAGLGRKTAGPGDSIAYYVPLFQWFRRGQPADHKIIIHIVEPESLFNVVIRGKIRHVPVGKSI